MAAGSPVSPMRHITALSALVDSEVKAKTLRNGRKQLVEGARTANPSRPCVISCRPELTVRWSLIGMGGGG